MRSVKGQRERILPPYVRQVNDAQHRILKTLGISLMVLVAMVSGYALALFGTFGWFIPAIPVVILAAVALWTAPDLNTNLDHLIQRWYFIFVGLVLIWPAYLAINLPGMPWISFQRIAMAILVAIALFALATSSRMRGEFRDVLTSHKILLRFFLAWVVIETLMVGVGKFAGISVWVRHTMFWYFMFIVSAWLMRKPGVPVTLARLCIVASALTAAVVIPEYMQSKPIWADHIPAFLSIDPSILESLQFGRERAGEYRSRSIFTNSLLYAEYLGMLIPFTLLAISWDNAWWRRLLACVLLLLLITAGTLTQARSAMVAMVSSVPAFLALWVWRYYRNTKARRDIIAPAMFLAFPAAAVGALALIFSIQRFRVRILGGGQHAASNRAREYQWDIAIPQIIRNPFGYGGGSIRERVPYTNLAGEFTIDSYPINVLIEQGVPGLIAFVGMLVTAIVVGIRVYLNSNSRDEDVAGAAVVSLSVFMLIRLIVSSESGQGLAFGLCGLILGIWYRQRQRLGAQEQQPPRGAPVAAGKGIPAFARSA